MSPYTDAVKTPDLFDHRDKAILCDRTAPHNPLHEVLVVLKQHRGNPVSKPH